MNFHPDLRRLMLEARYLDRQRFAIPPIALQVGITPPSFSRPLTSPAHAMHACTPSARCLPNHTVVILSTPPSQVALQEDEYRRWIEALEGLLERYYKVGQSCTCAIRFGFRAHQHLNSWALPAASSLLWWARVHRHICAFPQVVGVLSPAECDLLSSKLASLARSLEPGFSRLNWNSRGIDDFVGKAGAAVHEFQGLVNQVGWWRASM